MKNNAQTLRTLVMDNALELGRLSREQLGTEDYKELTDLYRNALDTLTAWASKDYAHKATTEDSDKAYAACKRILSIYATDESRIIIDQMSMRSLRDMSTTPRRLYSADYKAAMKSLKSARKTLEDRTEDLNTLGIAIPSEGTDITAWADSIPNDKRMLDGIDRVSLYVGALATVSTRAKKVEDIKAAGSWTWTRPVAVADNKFAELVENYVADCLIENYNIKTSKEVRDEKKASRK